MSTDSKENKGSFLYCLLTLEYGKKDSCLNVYGVKKPSFFYSLKTYVKHWIGLVKKAD